tara:strand:+ start:104 stop:235 length:132 start_codon:yes stop_codon:yes gene_type:complete
MNLSEGLSSENPPIASPKRLFFSRIRKNAASSSRHPGYRMIAA